MTDNIENNEPTTIELEEVTGDIEQVDFEEEIEVVDVDEVLPKEVDLKLEDEPFEIGMETVQKMQEAEDSRKQNDSEDSKKTSSSKSTSKDVMLTDFDDIMDSLKADNTKKVILITAILALVGSFFVFCQIKVGDIPAQSIGIFFNGFSGNIISNIISKICILAIIVSVVCVLINLKKMSFYAILIAVLTFIGQCVFFVVWGAMYYAIPYSSFRPGIGFIITLVSIIAMFFAVYKNKVTVRLY